MEKSPFLIRLRSGTSLLSLKCLQQSNTCCVSEGTGDEKLKPDMWGFIGCLKSLQVNGQKVSLQRLLLGDQSLPSGECLSILN